MYNNSDIIYLKNIMEKREILKEKYPGFIGRHINYTNNSNKIKNTLELIGKDNKTVYNVGEEFVKILRKTQIAKYKTATNFTYFYLGNF